MTRPILIAAALVVASLLASPAALAQSAGVLSISAEVQASILLSGTTPVGNEFVAGGDNSASADIPLLASPTQSFASSAVIANAPNSPGYQLVAKLAAPVNAAVTVDGVRLSTVETVIAPQAPYGEVQTYQVTISDPQAASAVVIRLTCWPK